MANPKRLRVAPEEHPTLLLEAALTPKDSCIIVGRVFFAELSSWLCFSGDVWSYLAFVRGLQRSLFLVFLWILSKLKSFFVSLQHWNPHLPDRSEDQIFEADRERMIQIMFDTFQVPALYLAVNQVLSLYASGRKTGLVGDFGQAETRLVPICEGFLLPHAVVKMEPRYLPFGFLCF